MMNVETNRTQTTPHSCLTCGRVVTRREQHEALEGRVLESIHVERFRELLHLRKGRGGRERAEGTRAGARQQHVTFALQILFAVVAVAAVALLAPVDWQQHFQHGADSWGAKR